MKKLCIVAVLAIFSFTSVNAQEGFSGGLHVGIPSGDISDFSGLNLGVDLSYLVNVAEGFDAGITSGYTHFTGKDQTFSNGDGGSITIEAEGTGFIPLAGTARYSFADNIFGAVDLGYAVSTQSGGSGAFYYQPKAGWKSETMDIFAFYKGMSKNGSTIAAFGVGAAFRL